jgi:hypothetical protein
VKINEYADSFLIRHSLSVEKEDINFFNRLQVQ